MKCCKNFALILFVGSLTMPAMAANYQEPKKAVMVKNHYHYKEGEIFEIMMEVDKNEIAAAKLALSKTANPAVKKLAEMMINDHTKHLEATKKLSQRLGITPVPSEKSSELKDKGKITAEKLSTLEKRQFDMAYTLAMVKGHSEVLKMLDEEAIPNASNPELSKLLQETRATVAHHLQMAQQTLKQLRE